MKNSIKRRVSILTLLVMTGVIFISLVGCGGFNEENAKKESRIELDNLLKVSENEKFIANSNDMDKIRAFVDENCNKYFTDDFKNKTKNDLSKSGLGNRADVFYLNNKLDFKDKVEKIKFYNHYDIKSPTVDKENETITYELQSSEVGIAPNMYVYVQMKKENGKWKINKTLQ